MRAPSSFWLAATSFALALALVTPGDASAVSGGGVSPIGRPSVLVQVYAIHGPYRRLVLGENIEPAMTESSDYMQVTNIFPDPATPSFPDRGDAYADAAGVFWSYASRVGAVGHTVDYPVRGGVFSSARWVQSFVKDRDDAWMTFSVSKAFLRVAAGAFCCDFIYGGDLGARARLLFWGLLHSGDSLGPENLWEVEQNALLQANGYPPVFQDLQADGPMGYTHTQGATLQTVEFDPHTGSVDLSGIHRGEEFTVEFGAWTYAESALAEGGSVVQAYFRDPLATGGGITVETDGLTPLDHPGRAPGPSDRAQAVAIQGGGIVAAGLAWGGTGFDFALARYGATDGALDLAFGSGGTTTADFSGGSDVAHAVAVQRDGKLVAVGTTSDGGGADFAVARHDASGALDPTFGAAGDGKVRLDLGGRDDFARAVVVQPDGKIVVAGSTWNGANRDIAVARLEASGELDPTFGGTGVVTVDVAGGSDSAESLALQPDGSIVVAGSADAGGVTRSDFALVRLDPDGALDGGFGVGGVVVTDFLTSGDFAEAVVVDADGRIVVAGHADAGGQADFAVARYLAAGLLDAGFGGGGRVLVDFVSGRDHARAIALQGDGKILVAGDTASAAGTDFALARLDAGGDPDPTFGSGGEVTVDFDGGDDRAQALAIQADGRIVAAGFAFTATGDDFALVRLDP